MASCLLGLGSNVGDRQSILNDAVSWLDKDVRVEVVELSEWESTCPAGGPAEQGRFLNGAAVVHTELSPQALLDLTQEIQHQFGRKSGQRWAARSLDIDLLLYDQLSFTSDRLTVPHPRMTFRRFVLEPAAQIASDMVHADINQTIENLLAHINTAQQYIAICEVGVWAEGEVSATALAFSASEQCDALRIMRDEVASDLPKESSRAAGKSDSWAIESLFRCGESLTTELYSPDQHLISDFWLEMLAIECGQSIVSRGHRETSIACPDSELRVLRPKLLVVLDSPSRQTERDKVARTKLWAAVRRYHRGPVLRLDARNNDWAVTEISAAFEAMR